jgi:hypothetical protein
MQHLSFYPVVHLDQTISCLSLEFPVAVEPVTSVNANFTIRQVLATIKELLECFAKVKVYTWSMAHACMHIMHCMRLQLFYYIIYFDIYTSIEREYYKVEIHVSPPQESYEIGSQVTLSCLVTPSSQNPAFPLRYQWYFPDSGSSYSTSINPLTVTINSYDQSFGSYYCLIYSRNSNLFLGQGRTTLNINGMIV